jgi:hypothetical protein
VSWSRQPLRWRRFTHSGWYKRQCMIAELAMGDLSHRQIGQKCGKTENNVKQFAWYYKKEIAEERARSYAELRLRCNGEAIPGEGSQGNQRRDERAFVEFAEVCNRLDLRFLEDQAVWNNYHAAFCRYRELKADIIRQSKRSWTLKPAVHVKRPK